ncbi:hypothetical protein HD806DRAFT_306240 [Xylariaceae sp. AK1471]|nr:hypothetical protein HD806DRAFT_306240 [Xylariaceae sp. AK1471]
MDTDSEDSYRASSSSESHDEIKKAQPPIHNPPSVSPAPIPESIPVSIPIRQKRRGESFTGPPPLKRARNDFNAAYLKLLNQDIQDASAGLIYDEGHRKPELEGHTQVGAVVWSAAEKEVFFSAVSRLGRDDLVGIAARIGTKSELEVRQYLMLLDVTATKRRDEGKGHALRPVDIPAAVEIGAQCGAALEYAADGLSLLQESYEEEIEKERWGSRWLITAPIAQILDNRFNSQQQQQSETSSPRSQPQEEGQEEQSWTQDGEEGREKQQEEGKDELPFLHLFPIQNWLQLSDRVFMNSAVSDGNWRAVSEEQDPPAIRATALADFHGLALSVTRRLVSATLYVAESRIRAKSLGHGIRRVRHRVRGEDVAAAVSSLGMKKNSMEFWARCARRLQMDVVDDRAEEDVLTDEEDKEIDRDTEGGRDADHEDQSSPAKSGPESDINDSKENNEDDDYEIMSYDEVETALNCPTASNAHERPSTPDFDISSDSSLDISSTSEYESETDEGEQEQDEEHEDTTMQDRQDFPTIKHEPDNDVDSDAIAQDLEEAITYSALIEHDATPAGQSIRSRIRAEHRLERDAERLDLQASADAEIELWAVLRGDGDLKTKNIKAKGSKSKGTHGEEGRGRGRRGGRKTTDEEDEEAEDERLRRRKSRLTSEMER